MRKWYDPVVITNFLFLINAKLWWDAGYISAALIVGVTGLASFSYHIPKESYAPTHIFDVCMAHFALVYTLYIAHSFISLSLWMGLLAVLSIGLMFKKAAHITGLYGKYHTLWHVCVFAGQYLLAKSVITA